MKKLFNKQILILLGVLLLIVGIFLSQFIIPEYNKVMEKKAAVEKTQQDLEQAKNSQNQAAAAMKSIKLPVTIFLANYPGSDLQVVSVDLVENFMKMVHDTNNFVTEVSFTTKSLAPPSAAPATTPSGSSPPSAAPAPPADASLNNAGILTLNLSLKSSYKSLQDLLNRVYNWEYLTGITSISIDKPGGSEASSNEMLDTKLTIDLYINKT